MENLVLSDKSGLRNFRYIEFVSIDTPYENMLIDTATNDSGCSIYINRDDAIQIVQYLRDQFKL